MPRNRPRFPSPPPVPAFPLVAVTATIKPWQGAPRARLNEAYLRAIEDTRLTPIVVAPLANLDRCDEILTAVGGLVLTGGEDVDPSEYGADRHPALGETNPYRDRWEIALVRAAMARRIPTLAICRGVQILNVALGGTLVQDIPAQRPGALRHEEENRRARVHAVDIVARSLTAAALGETAVTVNSVHHQAIDTLAPGLRLTGRSPDGLVEAVESEDSAWWAVGVQWHPEELTSTAEPWDRGLFSAFAERCRR